MIVVGRSIRWSVHVMFVGMRMSMGMTVGMSGPMGMIVRGFHLGSCNRGSILAEWQRRRGVTIERFHLDVGRRQLTGPPPDGTLSTDLEFAVKCGQTPTEARIDMIAQ